MQHFTLNRTWRWCLPLRNQALTVPQLSLPLLPVFHAIRRTGKRTWAVPGSSLLWLYWDHRYRFLRLPVLAHSEPGACLFWKAAWLAVVRNLLYLKIFPVPPLSAGQAEGEKVMRHLSPGPGRARHVTLAQKALKAALPAGPGGGAPLGRSWREEDAAEMGVRGAMEGRGQKACGVGTGLAGAGNQRVAEESWFHSYFSPPTSGLGRRHADPCPFGLLALRADEPLPSETGQWGWEADLPRLSSVEETLQWSDSSWIPQSPCRAYFNQLSLWFLFCFTFIKLAANVQHVVHIPVP